jgi:large repetitive protein
VPATGGYSGSSAATYGNSQTETITAHLTDTAGQSSGTATASATTVAAPPPTVSVSEGRSVVSTLSTAGTCYNKTCYFFNVSVANFPANTALGYTCADDGSVWWPTNGAPTSQTESGSTTTNGSGSASFTTYCIHARDGHTVTINVTGGGKSASGSTGA